MVVESTRERDKILLDVLVSEKTKFRRHTGMQSCCDLVRFVCTMELTSTRDKIFVWTDPTTSVEMALDFDHKEHCAIVWSVYSQPLRKQIGIFMLTSTTQGLCF